MPFIVVHGEDQYFAVQTSTDLPCASTPFANGIMEFEHRHVWCGRSGFAEFFRRPLPPRRSGKSWKSER